jgi:hypothetical protein
LLGVLEEAAVEQIEVIPVARKLDLADMLGGMSEFERAWKSRKTAPNRSSRQGVRAGAVNPFPPPAWHGR